MHREGRRAGSLGVAAIVCVKAVLCADPGQRLVGAGQRDGLLCLGSLMGLVLGEWGLVTRDSGIPQWHRECAQKGDDRTSSENQRGTVFTKLLAPSEHSVCQLPSHLLEVGVGGWYFSTWPF